MAKQTGNKIKSHHTWQEYLRRTGHSPAFSGRSERNTRMIQADTIVTGKHTGIRLQSLDLNTLRKLSSQATCKADYEIIEHTIAKQVGAQPGPPVV